MEKKAKFIKVDLFAVAPGVWGMKDVFVNVYAILNPSENNWFLVDAGLKWSAPKIKRMAELLFGVGSKPAAIILTHGHFDHVGSVASLARDWDVQVYAHHLEMPYLTGISSYPPADPTVGGGLMADVSFLYPKTPINIEDRVISLPQGGIIPGLPEWKYLHTPGHAPGHISLFRDSDKVLISGDAIVTTKQESALSVMLQLRKLSGPPKYFTSDWLSAAMSVELLAKLEPEVVASGHGRPIRGAGLRKSLHMLARDFEKVALPAQGRYVHQPALSDDTGLVHLPPKNRNATAAPTLKLLGIAAAVLITLMLTGSDKKKKKRKKLELAKASDQKDKAGNTFENIKSKGKQQIAKAGEEYSDLKKKGAKEFSKLRDDAEDEAQDYRKAGSKGFNQLKDAGQKEARQLGNSAEKGFNNVKDAGKKEAKRLSTSAEDLVDDTKDAGKKEAKRLRNSADDWLTDRRDAGKKEAKRLSASAGEVVDDTRDAAKKEAKHLRKSAEDWFTDKRDAGKAAAKRASASAGEMVEDSTDAAKKAAKKLGNSVERAFDNTKDAGRREFKQVKKAGKRKSDHLRESILDAIGHLKFPVRKGIKKIKRFGS